MKVIIVKSVGKKQTVKASAGEHTDKSDLRRTLMKRPEKVILRGEPRLFLSFLLAIILSAFAAANAFAAPFAYITNYFSDNVSVIDTATNTVAADV